MCSLRATRRARLDTERELEAARRRQREFATYLEARERDLAAWRESFAALTRDLPLGPDPGPDAALQVLQQVRDLVAWHDAAADARRRSDAIREEHAALQQAVEAFRSVHAPDLPADDPRRCVEMLRERLAAERRDARQREQLDATVARLERETATAQDGVKAAEERLGTLARDAGVAHPDELPQRLRDAEEKHRVRAAIAAREQDLRSTGETADAVCDRVATHADTDVESELARLRAEAEAAEQDARHKRDAARDAERARADLERCSGAADVATEIAGVAAGVHDAAAEYARLKLAEALLQCAVERYRKRSEAPLLRAASTHFARMTHGRYDRIETEYAPSGQLVFQVREPATGSHKEMSALSDGTRDQLHLALVLGALETLAAFSRRTQVLLFTHHGRVREQAAALGAGREVYTHDL